MSYFQFLGVFVVAPAVLLALAQWRQLRRREHLMIGGLSLVALVYTTPWDNYLVATGVWWYDPNLVTGITLGWVPLEEYTFFILQPILTGLWTLLLARRVFVPAAPHGQGVRLRLIVVAAGVIGWLAAVATFIAGIEPLTYLALIAIWALPPILLQLGFGIDILWRNGRLVLAAWLLPTFYLATADSLAINAGTWTINPENALPLYLGGVLPLEEFVFFLVTNALIAFSMVLLLAPASGHRVQEIVKTGHSQTSDVLKTSDV